MTPGHGKRGPAQRVRCAIYTRKSSDEGLEQSFNSLDAQREACSAYILSQASEGWAEVSERYDDGGLSGGTLKRPALQRLLADVAAGRVDIIVVYKVDDCDPAALAAALAVEREPDAPATLVLRSDVRLTRSGRAMRLVQADGAAVGRTPDRSLVRLLVRARGWWAQLRTGEHNVSALAAAEGISPAYLTRVLRLAFLAPAVVDAILAGTLRTGVDAAALTATDAIAPRWADQLSLFNGNAARHGGR